MSRYNRIWRRIRYFAGPRQADSGMEGGVLLPEGGVLFAAAQASLRGRRLPAPRGDLPLPARGHALPARAFPRALPPRGVKMKVSFARRTPPFFARPGADSGRKGPMKGEFYTRRTATPQTGGGKEEWRKENGNRRIA